MQNPQNAKSDSVDLQTRKSFYEKPQQFIVDSHKSNIPDY